MRPWLQYLEFKTKNGTIQEQVFVSCPVPYPTYLPYMVVSNFKLLLKRYMNEHAKNFLGRINSGKDTLIYALNMYLG